MDLGTDNVSSDELDALLDEGLPETYKKPPPAKRMRREKADMMFNGNENTDTMKMEEDDDEEMVDGEDKGDQNTEPTEENTKYTLKEKIVLVEKGRNNWDVLPGGWIEVKHNSGLPLYLHQSSRVCTLSRPYFLGPASVRKHFVPLDSIPCLAYKKALKEEEQKPNGPQLSNGIEGNQVTGISHTVQQSTSPSKLCPMSGISEHAQAEKSPEKAQENRSTDIASLRPNQALPETSEKSNEIADQNYKKFCDINEECKEDSEEVSKNIEKAAGDKTVVEDGRPSNHQNFENNKQGSGGLNGMPFAKVETAEENKQLNSLDPVSLRNYCEKLFIFKTLKVRKFKTWSDRRQHSKEQKRQQLQRPTLPDGVKFISFPVPNAEADGKSSKEYILNPQGKSSVCILHEYVQHALRKQPSYSFRELENATSPYSATVVINNLQYGTGYGSSKKQAKSEAAKATLEILIPQMKDQLDPAKSVSTSNDFDITEYFKQVSLTDPRITKMCNSISEPSPYALLLNCLQRNFGKAGSTNVKFEVIATGSQTNKFKMETDQCSVEVAASNKREGKQLASQALLSKLHPHIENFGAFLKLYGNGSIKSVKEKKQEEQQITTLQSKASANSPNWAIIDKLKKEMRKLGEKNEKNVVVSNMLMNEDTQKV